jgi:hypothetical protein
MSLEFHPDAVARMNMLFSRGNRAESNLDFDADSRQTDATRQAACNLKQDVLISFPQPERQLLAARRPR